MLSTTSDFQKTDFLVKYQPIEGLDGFVHNLIGRAKLLFRPEKSLVEQAEQILEEAETLRGLSDTDLRLRVKALQPLVKRQGLTGEVQRAKLLPLLVEISDRTLQLRPYREQVMGALALGGSHIVEMATGEGKTLTIAMAGVLAGWMELPVHIVTANDYLAERDARIMHPLYDFCKVTVSHVTQKQEPRERQEAYKLKVVYTTAKELVADFLRDRLRLGQMHSAQIRAVRNMLHGARDLTDEIIQRGLHTVILDEADNLMIDEAITPLIISRKQQNEALSNAIKLASSLATKLKKDEHYTREDKRQQIKLLPATDSLIEEQANQLDSVYRGAGWMRELVVKALVAQLYYHRDKHYVVQGDKIVIVDDFTGRLMEGRSWKQGLHQAVEAKEGVPITDPTESMASLSFQRFFNFFRQVSGITGTAREAAPEFWRIYNLSFLRIPVHKPCRRTEHKPRLYLTLEEKWAAIVEEVVAAHKDGRPILVGSRSIHDSEHVAELLEDRGITSRVLNARSESEEAMIIARAGEESVVTVATNMAGRGTDIKLGRDVAELGGLHVLSTEMNESRRIDRQLFGRSGRQGDPGSAVLFASFEDELIKKHCPIWLSHTAHSLVRLQLPFSRWIALKVFQKAQKNASRQAYRRRKSVMRQDRWLEEMFALNSMEFGR